MADNEQELLSDREIQKEFDKLEKEKPDFNKRWVWARHIAKAQVAKLKALGYVKLEEIASRLKELGLFIEVKDNKLILSGWMSNDNTYVKWDRKKVAEVLGSYAFKKSWYSLNELQQEASLGYADQLKEILTGGI